MGLNTAVVVLNDHLSFIETDEFFGAKVAEAVRDVHRDGGHHNSFAVLPSGHADYDQVVVIGGNRIRRFDQCEDAEQILRRLADSLGFSLRRKPS
jgi:hypothetical protein